MGLPIAVIGPVLNEAEFIWASVMAVYPYVEEFVYAVSPKSDDGTIEILRHIAKRYGKVRLLLQSKYDFDPLDTAAYNASYNDCVEQTRCPAVWFLHPDQVVTTPEKIADIQDGPLAWTVNMTSYAGDMNTQITKGRCNEWKSIHAKKFGLTYMGGYGSREEDFYHTEITGKSLKHYGTDFHKYPFRVESTGIEVNHYCECKPYARRLAKMKNCLKTLVPEATEAAIEKAAREHPRVTLKPSSTHFGHFEFATSQEPLPPVFEKYRAEFEPFIKKEPVCA